MVLLDGARANDSEKKGLGVEFGWRGGGDGINVDDENATQLTPKRFRDEVGRTTAIMCVPVNFEFILKNGCQLVRLDQ